MQKAIGAGFSLRKAGLGDGPFLLSVRNAPEIRAQSKDQGIIPEPTHVAWLRAQLGSPNAVIWIVQDQGQREGYVRAQEIEAGTLLLSIALQAGFQGKGHGTWAVHEACRVLFETRGARSLLADVKVGNAAARRLFESAGFAPVSVETHKGLDFARFKLYAGELRSLPSVQ